MNYLDQLREAGKLQACPECNSMDAVRPVLLDSGPHHAALVCDACPDEWSKYDRQRFIRFLPPPKNLTGRPKRGKASTNLLPIVRDAQDGEPLYCLICLRDERFLPEGVWMEAHHILEHQDGGTDHAANLMPLCNQCHSLVHWRRRDTEGGGAQVISPRPDESPDPGVAHAPG